MTEASDEDLLLAVGRGDEEALARLYERHGRLALALAYRICGDWPLAEEAVQEAFLSVWRRAATFDPQRGEGRTWLFSVVHNRAVDRVRRHRTGTAGGSLEPLTDALAGLLRDESSLAVADLVERRLAGEAVREALAGLPPEQREAIALAYFGGLTTPEIAARTGAPVGTVKGRLRLGLEKMRSILRGRDSEGMSHGAI